MQEFIQIPSDKHNGLFDITKLVESIFLKANEVTDPAKYFLV
jgi:hypothetical protein